MKTIEEVADYMREHRLMLVTAESCTSGLIAATLADIPRRRPIAGLCLRHVFGSGQAALPGRE